MKVSGSSDVIDLMVHVHHRTDKAVLVSDDGDRKGAVWLPLSAIEIEELPGGITQITLPEQLALDKGLI